MIPSTTTTTTTTTTSSSSMSNNSQDRKRRNVSLTNAKKLSERTHRNTLNSLDKSKSNEFERNNSESNEILDEFNPNKLNIHKTSSTITDLTLRSTKVFQLVLPRTNSIKMLVNADGLASVLRRPARIQLTKTLSTSNNSNSTMDYPLTPPPPILDRLISTNDLSKRLSDWSIPPTSELSPTSLPSSSSPDDSLVELDSISSTLLSIKSRHRSCPILPRRQRKSKSISQTRSVSPVIKCSSIERLKRRRRDQEIYGKRLKIKTKSDEQIFIIQQLLNDIIEQIDDKDQTLKLFLNTPVSQFKTIIKIKDEHNSDVQLDSTPLTFHSTGEDQSPNDVPKTHIFTDIVNELIKGAKGLDKLSCSLVNFTNSIHNFIRLNLDKQKEKIQSLENELDKKCSSQLTRAKVFCTKKIDYFIGKYPFQSNYLDEITLIVQYFYFYVLLLNCRKQENEFELILTDLINEKYSFIQELFSSSILTSIIEDFILPSSLANEYLLSQPIVINQLEYSLPFVRNLEYENELLFNAELANPFSDLNDLESYLNCCEHYSTSIPYYPPQQSMYYPPSGQYYYHHPSTDMSNYYYQHPHPSSYGYNHHSGYFNSMASYHEQFNYYYNQSTVYNSTNDIPMMNKNVSHSNYRRGNSNTAKKDITSPQSNPMYPS